MVDDQERRSSNSKLLRCSLTRVMCHSVAKTGRAFLEAAPDFSKNCQEASRLAARRQGRTGNISGFAAKGLQRPDVP